MKIKSKNLKGGLYGQLLLWCLELLPYLEEKNIDPLWEIESEFYGTNQNHNIIGNYIKQNNQKISEDYESIDLLDLKLNQPNFFKEFKGDFIEANRLFFKFFSFSDEITEEVDEKILEYKGKKILGLHYRGTDKINTEGGYINVDMFKSIVDDYLNSNEIEVILIFSDELYVSKTLEEYYSKKYIVKNFNDKESKDLLYITYENYSHNNLLFKKTIVEPLILSKCDVVIKTSSQFSAWSKIFNPYLNIYRSSSFKENWFPDFYIPIYSSEDDEIKKILGNIFIDENKTQKS